jgi:hypothetical protein
MPRNKRMNGLAESMSKDRPRSTKSVASTVYQLKITLTEVKPPIWRRIEVKDCTLAELHEILQVSMGWQECHLHLFKIGSEHYGDPDQWPKEFADDVDTLNEGTAKLSQLLAKGVQKFLYTYDMGDCWEHTVRIEKTFPAEPGVKYPRCSGGQRACPPEDCGGAWGYGDFVEAIQDPKHEQHDELLEWVGGEFDPEEFDLEETDKALEQVR